MIWNIKIYVLKFAATPQAVMIIAIKNEVYTAKAKKSYYIINLFNNLAALYIEGGECF